LLLDFYTASHAIVIPLPWGERLLDKWEFNVSCAYGAAFFILVELFVLNRFSILNAGYINLTLCDLLRLNMKSVNRL
jgi:hypothetical protein